MDGQDDMFGELVSTARMKMFAQARVKSAHCPCCDKHVKVYRRKFNSGMAVTMIYTYPVFRRYPGRYLDVLHYCTTTHEGYVPGEVGKLCWWGLMERKPEDPKTGAKTTGLYRMTDKGLLFTERKIQIPGHAVEYMSNVESFSDDEIDIVQALGKHFNYHELMRTPGIM